MSLWQLLRQLAYLLNARVWPQGAGEVVFGPNSVIVTPGPSGGAWPVTRCPVAILWPVGFKADAQNPRIKVAQIGLHLAVAHQGDTLGQAALLGGQKTGGVGSSKGAGLLQVEEQVFAVLDLLLPTNGVRVQCVAAGAAEGSLADGSAYVAERTYTLEAIVTTARHYPPPNAGKNLTTATPGGGACNLSWSLPPTRFDFGSTPAKGGLVLRRASGSTPPADPGAGNGVTLSGSWATSVADAPGAGTFSYALFAGYDDGEGLTRYGPDGTYTAVATATGVVVT